MNKKEIKSIMSLISERQEVAYKRLKGNLEYQKICDIQEENLKEIEKLYFERFTKEEYIAIRHYYEGILFKLSKIPDDVWNFELVKSFSYYSYLFKHIMSVS